VSKKNQFITIAIFELDDEVGIYEEIISKMAEELEPQFDLILKYAGSPKIDRLEEIDAKIEKEMRFAIFQIERLSNLDKIQKAALIFQNPERFKILELLREKPISRRKLRNILEKLKPNPNIDLLIRPFLELNLIKRDWIKGQQDEADDTKKGEFFFLVKDITFARLPNEEIISKLKQAKPELFLKYKEKIEKFFNKYDPTQQDIDMVNRLARAFLIPDCFDFYKLMKNNYYPTSKLPKIFSDFVDTDFVLDLLEYLNIITLIEDDEGEEWVLLFADLEPFIIFPEYSLPQLIEAYKEEEKQEEQISLEVAKKALQLMETSYNERVEF
jgi:hypothetical protein